VPAHRAAVSDVHVEVIYVLALVHAGGNDAPRPLHGANRCTGVGAIFALIGEVLHCCTLNTPLPGLFVFSRPGMVFVQCLCTVLSTNRVVIAYK
jgi:hypothetical protein